MNFWRLKSSDKQTTSSAIDRRHLTNPESAVNETDGKEQPGVVGERGVSPVNTFKSVQSRVSSALTVTLMILLSAGLLIWYYSAAMGRGAKVRSVALAEQQRRAQGDSTLPPLGPLHLPTPSATSESKPAVVSTEAPGNADSPLQRILGAPPEAPPDVARTLSGSSYAGATNTPPLKTRAQLAEERRLAGPVLAHASSQESGQGGGGMGAAVGGPMMAGWIAPGAAPAAESARQGADSPSSASLESLLHATTIPAVAARILPTQRYLLPKGSFIDCTLETAISSSLPGMTTCVTATDTFSADGQVVLLERGTKLIGETRGMVQAGSPRLFVLWNEARTPAGIVVPLTSPGTDELGRSGLTGSVDWHWWQRFGAATLVTLIDGAVQAAADRGGTSVQINPSGASTVMTEVLRDTLAIPPTINKSQGDRLEILVARDVDFRSVYELRTSAGGVR